MTCVGIDQLNNTRIVDILSYPSSCDFQFWAKIMAGFFIILAFILYKSDEEKQNKGEMISCLGVSGLATIFVSLAGTLVGFIESIVFLEILIGCLIFVILWMFKK